MSRPAHLAYLRTHTYFSLTGGPASPHDWCTHASSIGYTALGIADRAPLASLPDFISSARKTGLTPVCGMELDLLLPLPATDNKNPTPCHTILLLAQNHNGLLNLAKLSALAYTGWPATSLPINWQDLLDHASGLALVLVPPPTLSPAQPLTALPTQTLAQLAHALREGFGDAAFVGLPANPTLAAQLATIADHLHLPPLALPLALYPRPSDAPSYHAFRLARANAHCNTQPPLPALDEHTPHQHGPHYLRPPQEIARLFEQWPDSLHNLQCLIQTCQLDDPAWPHTSPFTRAFDQAAEATTALAALTDLGQRQLASTLQVDHLPQQAIQRLNDELTLIQQCGQLGSWFGLAALMNLVHPPDPPANKHQHTHTQTPVGAPLGLADGSLLAYALGACPLDPTPHTPPWLSTSPTTPLPPPGIEVPATCHHDLLTALASQLGPDRLAYAARALPITPAQALQAAAATLGIDHTAHHILDLLHAAHRHGWSAFQQNPSQPHLSNLISLATSLRDAPISFLPDPHVLLVAPHPAYGHLTLPQALPALPCTSLKPGSWVPWPLQTLCELRLPALWLRPSSHADTLHIALTLARQFPTDQFDPSSANLQLHAYPRLSDRAVHILSSGQIAGIPYLHPQATRGQQWQNPITPHEAAQLVIHSLKAHHTGHTTHTPHKSNQPQPPCAFSPHQAAAWGRIALWAAQVKALHPAALLASALWTAWTRGETSLLPTLVQQAHRSGVPLQPPDPSTALPLPTLQPHETGWSILWGLAMLPGWDLHTSQRFVAARPPHGFTNLHELAQTALHARLSTHQLQTLIQSGACDQLGGRPRNRQALLKALPAALQWATQPTPPTDQPQTQPPPDESHTYLQQPLTPRQCYTLHLLEKRLLGVPFTPAPHIHALRRALDSSGELPSRLLTTRHIGPHHTGKTICLVGILCSIHLLNPPDSLHPLPHPNGSHNRPTHPHHAQPQPPIAVGRIEDLHGSIELIAFPPNYTRHQHLWLEGNLVIVTARLALHPHGQPYLLCQHLAPFHPQLAEPEPQPIIKPKTRKTSTTSSPSQPQPQPQPQPPAPSSLTTSTTVKGQPRPPRPSTTITTITNTNTPTSPADPHNQTLTPTLTPPSYKLIITLPPTDDDQTAIDIMLALHRILKRHPGPDPVTLRIPYSPQTGHLTSARLPEGVTYTPQLENEISDLLGPDALAVIKLI